MKTELLKNKKHLLVFLLDPEKLKHNKKVQIKQEFLTYLVELGPYPGLRYPGLRGTVLQGSQRPERDPAAVFT